MHPIQVIFLILVTNWGNAWSSPVPRRVVDLTHVFDNTTISYPLVKPFESRVIHFDQFGHSVQVEEYSSSTHSGTHIDAPCHFVPGQKTLLEIPFNKLIGRAAVVDTRDKVAFNPDYDLQIDDLLQWEHVTGHQLNDVILLLRTGWSKHYRNATEYIGNSNNNAEDFHFPGMSVSAIRWLASNRDVYGIGMDILTVNADNYKSTVIHVILGNKNMYIMENVADMSELPLYGATLYVMPMKMGEACGASARIIATFPDKH